MLLSCSGLRRLGRPGARRLRRPSTPRPLNARYQREAVVRLTPNLRATWDCESPPCRSCAANRRLLSISSRGRIPWAVVSRGGGGFVGCKSDYKKKKNRGSEIFFGGGAERGEKKRGGGAGGGGRGNEARCA